METSLTGGEAKTTYNFVILSFCSWIMLLITSWMTIWILGTSKNKSMIFLLIGNDKSFSKLVPEPLDINFAIFIIIIILILVIETLGFLIYILSIYKRDNNVLNGMFGETTKFHFVPIILIASLFIISECYADKEKEYDAQCILSLIFTVLAIITLIFVSLRTQIESPLHATLTIKGTYSCFLAFLVYYFGYLFTIYGIFKKNMKDKPTQNWMKKCDLAFTILIGILNTAFSFLLKDVIISLMNFLIYLGLTINYFRLKKDYRKYFLYKNETIGIFDIIMMVLSIVYISFHIFRYRGIIPSQGS